MKHVEVSVPIFDIYVDFMADGLRKKTGKRFKDNNGAFRWALADLWLKTKRLQNTKNNYNWLITIKLLFIEKENLIRRIQTVPVISRW